MVRYISLTYPTVAQPKYQSWRSHIPPHHWAHHTEKTDIPKNVGPCRTAVKPNKALFGLSYPNRKPATSLTLPTVICVSPLQQLNPNIKFCDRTSPLIIGLIIQKKLIYLKMKMSALVERQ